MALVSMLAHHLGSVRQDVHRSTPVNFALSPTHEGKNLLCSVTFIVCVLMKKSAYRRKKKWGIMPQQASILLHAKYSLLFLRLHACDAAASSWCLNRQANTQTIAWHLCSSIEIDWKTGLWGHVGVRSAFVIRSKAQFINQSCFWSTRLHNLCLTAQNISYEPFVPNELYLVHTGHFHLQLSLIRVKFLYHDSLHSTPCSKEPIVIGIFNLDWIQSWLSAPFGRVLITVKSSGMLT